jgi:hypothetical protein
LGTIEEGSYEGGGEKDGVKSETSPRKKRRGFKFLRKLKPKTGRKTEDAAISAVASM